MLSNRLKFCCWNIHGYNSRDIGNKFYDKEFLNTLQDFDFVGVTETHIYNEIIEKINIPGILRISVKKE